MIADYSNIESSTDIKIRSGFNLNNYSHEQLEQKLCAFVFIQLKNDKIVKVSIMDESVNPQAHFLIPANCILPAFFYTQKMDTSIQANGMIIKDKEKLTTRTETSILDTGIMIMIMIV